MANDPNTTHEQKFPEPPAGGMGRETQPGNPMEGNSPGRKMQERGSLLTKEATDAEAEDWDERKGDSDQ
jgi:hypothetical protein